MNIIEALNKNISSGSHINVKISSGLPVIIICYAW